MLDLLDQFCLQLLLIEHVFADILCTFGFGELLD